MIKYKQHHFVLSLLFWTSNYDIIPHLHNSFLFQRDVIWSLNHYESPEKNCLLTEGVQLYTDSVEHYKSLKSFLIGFDFRPFDHFYLLINKIICCNLTITVF